MADQDETNEPEAEAIAEGTKALPGSTDEYPPIDFNTFVLSLSTSALMSLGQVPDPATNRSDVNLPLAKQTIELIELLEQKTKGNLTGEEERLVSQVLYDLRMQYVHAHHRHGK